MIQQLQSTMASVNWNEYNDSSSVSSMSSGLSDVVANQGQKEIKTPTLNKHVSSPDPNSKNISERQIKIDENLEKLKKYKGDTVFLYVPQNQRNKNKVDEEDLSKEDGLIEVTYTSKGWQVLTSIQRAQKLIQKGLFINGVNVRFLYSMKNQNKNKPREFISPNPKGNRRAKQFSSPNYNRQIKSQKFKEKNQDQRNVGKNEGEKKKVKYIAKKVDQKVEQTQIEKPQKTKQKQREPEVEEKQKKQLEKQRERQYKVEQKQKEDQDDSSNSSQELKKMKKELLKKKSKKKGKGKGGYQDNNNPFASFAGHD